MRAFSFTSLPLSSGPASWIDCGSLAHPQARDREVSSVSINRTISVNDLVDPARGNTDSDSELVLGNIHLREQIFHEDLPGMHRGSLAVAVQNLHLALDFTIVQRPCRRATGPRFNLPPPSNAKRQ